jgi:hypothetical protein
LLRLGVGPPDIILFASSNRARGFDIGAAHKGTQPLKDNKLL